MKRLLSIVMLLAAFSMKTMAQVNSAEVKTEKYVYKNNIHRNFIVETSTNKSDAVEIRIQGQNQMYHMVSIVAVFDGTKDDAIGFLNQLTAFYKDHDAGASTTINGQSVKLKSFLGKTQLYVSQLNGAGFVIYDLHTVEKMLTSLQNS